MWVGSTQLITWRKLKRFRNFLVVSDRTFFSMRNLINSGAIFLVNILQILWMQHLLYIYTFVVTHNEPLSFKLLNVIGILFPRIICHPVILCTIPPVIKCFIISTKLTVIKIRSCYFEGCYPFFTRINFPTSVLSYQCESKFLFTSTIAVK